MMKYVRLFAFATICSWCAGCATQQRLDLSPHTGGSAFLFNQFQAFDGDTGRPLRFADLVKRCRNADVVLFGEQHGDAICNQLEAQLLRALFEADRPLMLAMEFFETDTQATLDAYLTGRLDEPDFLEQSKRSSSYLNSHRPLIELCRAARVPVIAANAPRRLVRAYRKSGLTYQEYRAGLDVEDRQWLPTANEYLEGPYRDRFAGIMKGHGVGMKPATQPASDKPAGMPTMPSWDELYKAQLLWDESMAESIASFRDRFPRHRVMLLVGGFHVANGGGTAQKLHNHRPHDKLFTIVYRSNPNGQFAFDEEDHGAGNVVIYGLTPPKPKKPAMPMPTKKPITPPTESQPTSAPATMPAS